MKDKTFKLEGGLSYVLAVPATIAEFAALAKSTEDSVLDAAINEIVYRGPQADVREAMCDAIEAETGIERKRKEHPTGKKDDKGNVIMLVDESAGRFISRAAETLSKEVKDFQPLLDAIMAENAKLPAGHKDKIVFDPSQSEPKGRTLKPGKSDLEYADKILEFRSDPSVFAQKMEIIGGVIGRTLAADVDREQLALALRDYRQEMDKRSKAGLLAK